MSPNSEPQTTVRIVRDGACFIDDEYFATPPGANLNEAVLEHLRLEAAALEQHITAEILDEQQGYTVTIVVKPDGSTSPVPSVDSNSSDPPPSASNSQGVQAQAQSPDRQVTAGLALRRPYEGLPEPFRSRLQAACAAIEAGNVAEATTSVDAIIAELTDAFGPSNRSVLAAGVVRGDIALITHDSQYGLRIWAYIAETWQRIVGHGDMTTIPMVGNALWCWSQLDEPAALATRETIITLLQRVPVPGGDSSLQNVYRRLQQLARQ